MENLPRDLAISIVIVAIVLFIIKEKTKKFKLLSWNFVCVIEYTFFVVIIFSLTGISPISGFGFQNFGQGINFVPIVGIVNMLKDGIDFYSISNVAGNILMFAPIGFFAPILYKKYNSWLKITLVGLEVSLIIECSQLFLARGTDIDDLILNTLGAVIGYGIYKLFTIIMPRMSGKIAKANENNGKYIFWICVMACYVTIVVCGFYDRAVFLSI